MPQKILFVFILAVCFLSADAQAVNYFISPQGDDTHNGRSPEQAWATLQRARSAGVAPGDTVFIMGGTYTTAQYFHDGSGTIRGTQSAPIVFKAYGDSPAVFTLTGLGVDRRFFLFYHRNNDHITIDGYGYLNNEPLMLSFAGHEQTGALVQFGAASLGDPVDYTEGILIRGAEFDGSNHDYVESAIQLSHTRTSIVEDNYIHHMHKPTGSIPPGDGSQENQSTGYGLYLKSCELVTVRNNRIERCNHGSIYLEAVRGATPPSGHGSRYNKIINNVIDNRYGGGIYLSIHNPHHNLIDGNIIVRCGETTTFPKGAMQISGSMNTIRRNVVYNPGSQGIGVEAQSVIGYHNIADGNMIYNNTIYGCHKYNYMMLVKNWGSPDCSAERNTIVNNIFYKSHGYVDDSNGRDPEIQINLYDANDAHNWCDPNTSGCMPNGTNWGWNTFHNNCIRRNEQGADYYRLIIWARDATYGGGWNDFSLSTAQYTDPIAWANNIGEDPRLTNEYPDAYGLTNGWWYLQADSPCIDAGIPVYDTLGAYVESLYPGYGWGNLSYAGAAPDIGAHEFDGENPAPLSGPNIRIFPLNR